VDDANNHAGKSQIDPTAAPIVVMKYGNKVAIVRRTIPSSSVTPDQRNNFEDSKMKPGNGAER
jgi:hypothetical protein